MRKAMMGPMLIVVAVMLAACGGLAGEPEIVGQMPVQQQSPQTIDVVAPDIEPNLLLGERIFAENCVRCHGLRGAGDGDLVLSGQVQGLPDFTDPTQHEGKTAQDYYRQVTLGNLENLMPPFSGSLNDNERWAVANFVFTLVDAPVSVAAEGRAGLDYVALSDKTTNTTYEESSNSATGVVTGTVTLATESTALPEYLTATLYVFDMDMKEQSFETTVNSDGTYQFSNVTIDDQHSYYVSVPYGDGFFNSDFLRGSPETSNMILNVTLYDVTDDSSVLQLTSVLTQVDLLSDNTLRIWQMYNWVNNSDKLFSTVSASGQQLSVHIPVPNGASLADSNDMTRFIYDSENGYVYDSYPLLPNQEHSFYLQYTAPFSGEWELNQQFDYELTGVYQVYADEAIFDLEANGWAATQTQEFQGVVYRGLGTVGNAASLAITISSKGVSVNFDKQTMGMILTVFGIVFIGIAALLFVKGSPVSKPLNSEKQIQDLMEGIVELDSMYQAGSISEEKYKKRRKILKAQLTTLMKIEN